MDTKEIKFCQITKENANYFAALIPIEYVESDLFLGAYADEEPCAVILGDEDNDDFYLKYIFVREDYRRQHIGSRLVNYLRLIIKVHGFSTIYCNFVTNNEYIEAFIKSAGFKLKVEEGEMCSFKLKDVVTMNAARFTPGPNLKLSPIKEVGNKDWYQFADLCKDEFVIYERSEYDQELSLFRFNNNKFDGAMLISKFPSGLLINFLYSKDANQITETYIMVCEVLKRAREVCPEDTLVYANLTTKSVRKLMETMLNGRFTEEGKCLSGFIAL